MTYILTWLAATWLDVFYTRWVLHVSLGQKWAAALCSMLIGLCGLVGLTAVVQDHWAAIPYLLGLGCGTLVGMWKL